MNFLQIDFSAALVLDIVLGILAVVLISVINEKKQSRSAYFITLAGILALLFYFITKYLLIHPDTQAVNSGYNTQGGEFHMPWASLIWSLVIFVVFGGLTFLASRPWNVVPPKLSYPVDDKGSNAIRDETPEEKAQRQREEKYRHWPSIIGYAGMGLSILLCTWVNWMFIILLFAFAALVGFLPVQLRRRWLIKLWGDLIQDRCHWLLTMSRIREVKTIRDFSQLKGETTAERDRRRQRHLDRMFDNGFFMDSGLNWIPLLVIFLPFVKIEAMQYEEVEVRFQTDQLPTLGHGEDINKDGKEDVIQGAAATISLDQRIKCVIGEFPFTYIYKTGADRSEAVQVTARFIASFNAQELGTMTLGEAMFYPFFEGSRGTSSREKSHLPMPDDVKKAHLMILPELDEASQAYIGVGITDYKVLDKNPDDTVQKAMNDVSAAKIREEIRLRDGVAAGNEAMAEIKQLVDEFGWSEQEAAWYLIQRERARHAQTQYVDGLGDIASGAAAFGAARSSGGRPRSGGGRSGSGSAS